MLPWTVYSNAMQMYKSTGFKTDITIQVLFLGKIFIITDNLQ